MRTGASVMALAVTIGLGACTVSTTDTSAAGSAGEGARGEASASEPKVVAPPSGEPAAGADLRPTDDRTDACMASKVRPFVGKRATPSVREEVMKAAGHDRIRWLDPDSVITMDFRSDRLNVMLDKAGVITGAKCQ